MELIILQDSREQRPYVFPDYPVIRTGLMTGDYSLLNFEGNIGIERKSLDDLVGSLSGGRKRFEAELERGSRMDYFSIVVESDMRSILQGKYRSRMSPAAVLGSLEAYSVRYKVPVWFAGDRAQGQALTQRLLVKFYKEMEKVIEEIVAREDSEQRLNG